MTMPHFTALLIAWPSGTETRLSTPLNQYVVSVGDAPGGHDGTGPSRRFSFLIKLETVGSPGL